MVLAIWTDFIQNFVDEGFGIGPSGVSRTCNVEDVDAVLPDKVAE